MNSRERVLRFVQGQEVDRIPLMPITMMFASDQIGAAYRDYTFDHRVLAEAQMATAEKFDFDHVSTITETREAPDCGAEIRVFNDQPYAIDESRSCLVEKDTLAELHFPDPQTARFMSERLRALELLKTKVGGHKIVEGWVEGPCGGGADLRGINRLMLDFYDDPEWVLGLFDFVVSGAIKFGCAQIEAGADLIGIGDPAASLVGPEIYRRFVWPGQKRIVDGLQAAGGKVRLHICGNTRAILRDMGRLGCEMIDIDSRVSMAEARASVGPQQVLAGGVDPVRVLRNGTAAEVFSAVSRCHGEAGGRYVVAAGCEIPRGTPEENMLSLTDYAGSHGPEAA